MIIKIMKITKKPPNDNPKASARPGSPVNKLYFDSLCYNSRCNLHNYLMSHQYFDKCQV